MVEQKKVLLEFARSSSNGFAPERMTLMSNTILPLGCYRRDFLPSASIHGSLKCSIPDDEN